MSLAADLRLALEVMGFEFTDTDDAALFDCMLKNGNDVGRAANAWMDAAGLPIVLISSTSFKVVRPQRTPVRLSYLLASLLLLQPAVGHSE